MRIGRPMWWHIQTISTKQKELVTEIAKYKMDIVCLAKTKKKGQGNETLAEYMYMWSGVNKSESSKAGVSFLIKKLLKQIG